VGETGKWIAGCCTVSMVVFLFIITAMNLLPMATNHKIASHELGLPFTGYIANGCCALSGLGVLLGIMMLLMARPDGDEDEDR